MAIIVSTVPRETWLSTQIVLIAASLKIVLPWKWLRSPSHQQLVLTIDQTLWQQINSLRQSNLLSTCPRPKYVHFLLVCCHKTWGLHFLAWASSQDVHFGIKQFEVDANLCLITVGIKECFPFGCFEVCTCMSSYMWCILIPQFPMPK